MRAIEKNLNEKVKFSPLVSDQSWLLAILAGAAFVIAMVVVFIVSMFTEIEISAWEVVGSIAPWYVAIMGGWITYNMAPMFVAHGRTREFAFREWLTTGAFMMVIGTVAMTIGYLLEYWIYDIANFPGRASTENFFKSATDVHLVLVQYLLFFAVWFALGGFVGISLYRSDDAGWMSIPVAVAIAAATGALGYSSSGFMGVIRKIIPAFDFDSIWLEISILVIAAAFGVYITRELLKTFSLRNP